MKTRNAKIDTSAHSLEVENILSALHFQGDGEVEGRFHYYGKTNDLRVSYFKADRAWYLVEVTKNGVCCWNVDLSFTMPITVIGAVLSAAVINLAN